MKNLLEPYEGKEPYAFISYSHKDSEKVFEILGKLQDKGLRLWYDRGITLGSDWSDDIANHICNCKCMLAFHSQNSAKSRHCKNEIYFAVKEEKNILSIFLEEVKLDPGIEMQLAPYQAVKFYQNPEDFYDRLSKSEFLDSCYKRLYHKIEGEVISTNNNESSEESYQIHFPQNISSRLIPEEKIVPVIFVLDTSGSMIENVKNLSKSIEGMLEELKRHSNSSKWDVSYGTRTAYVNYEIAIITFDSEVKILMDYIDVEKINRLPIIEAKGATALGTALKTVKYIIEDTSVTWEDPRIILVTDGYPMDEYKKILNDFITNGRSAKCKRYAIGIGIGKNVDEEILKQFADKPILTKTDLELEQSFQIITNIIIKGVILW